MNASVRSRRGSLLGTLIGVAVLVAAACGGANTGAPTAPTPKLNDATSALVAAARGELELALSWAPGFFDYDKEMRRQIDGFNKLYGLNLKVSFKPGASLPESSARTIRDYQQGGKASTDVVLGTETEISDMQKAGALITEPWVTWASNITNPRYVAAGGVAVRVQTRIPGITYNSDRLQGNDIPRTLSDLLKPQYKGRVATTPEPGMFERLGGSEVWGPEKMLIYARKLGPQISGLINCGDEDRVASGEFDVFVYDCGSARVAQMKAKGTLIGWTVPTDAALLGYLYMGVPKNAAHPNAAKLWINYMLSRDAQDAMYDSEYSDYHLLPGSHSFAEVDKATKAGVKFYELTVEAVLVDGSRGARDIGPELKSIFQQNPGLRR